MVVLKEPFLGWQSNWIFPYWSVSIARLNSENLQLIHQAYGDDAMR
jgi:hypothetical protein